jgi:hypothetical protein
VYEEDLLTDKRRSIRISQKLLSVLGVVTHSWLSVREIRER